jgi:hypothetical protein
MHLNLQENPNFLNPFKLELSHNPAKRAQGVWGWPQKSTTIFEACVSLTIDYTVVWWMSKCRRTADFSDCTFGGWPVGIGDYTV